MLKQVVERKEGLEQEQNWNRESHIQLMEKTGVFYRIVMCYLEENPTIRSTELNEVIV